MSVVDLDSTSVASQSCVHRIDVALFKAEVENKRVMAHSQDYIVYSLKASHLLRIIRRRNNRKGTFRMENPICGAQFVNYQSNVLAVASEDTFLVIFVTDEPPTDGEEDSELNVQVYFQLKDTVRVQDFRFFINPTLKSPDLFILYGQTAAVLESSKIINQYEDKPLTATLSEHSRELRSIAQPLGPHSVCSVNKTGWFAFVTEPTLAVACTWRNRATPAWQACQGEAIIALSLLESAEAVADNSPASLIAASTAKVCQWRVSSEAEPVHLRSFTFSGSPLVTALCSADHIAIFARSKRVAIVHIRDESKTGQEYELYTFDIDATVVPPNSVCFYQNRANSLLLIDRQSEKKLQQFQLSNARAQDERSLGEGNGISPMQRLIRHAEGGNLRSNAASAAAGAAAAADGTAAAPMVPVVVPRSVVLHNASLLQSKDGPIAAAVYESDVCVRDNIEQINATVKMMESVLEVTPTLLANDVDDLISLALEAEITALADGVVARGGTGSGQARAAPATAGLGGSRPNRAMEDVFNSYGITSLMAPLASNLVAGIRSGVERAMQQDLEPIVRATLTDELRRQQSAALRRRLEEALQSSTEYYTSTLRKRMDEFATRELREAVNRGNATVLRLAEENKRLREALSAATRGDLIDQVLELQAEIQALRAAVRSGQLQQLTPAGGAAGGRANPETMLAHARALIVEQHNAAAGLGYIVEVGQPMLTLALLRALPEDAYDALLGDAAVPQELWLRTVAQLCQPACTENKATAVADTNRIAEMVFDMLSMCDSLVKQRTAAAQQILTDIRHFIANARLLTLEEDSATALKSIEKLIQ